MNTKRWIALGIAAFLFAFSVVTSIFSTILSSDFQRTMDDFMKPTNSLLAEEVIEEGNLMKKIAVLDVNGTIQDTGSATSVFATAGYNHQAIFKKSK